MPYYTTNLVQAAQILDLDTTGETVYIASGVLVMSTSAITITGTNDYENITVHGELASANITVSLDGDYNTISVGTSGIISNTQYGDYAAIIMGGVLSHVNNAGNINGSIGLWMSGHNSSITNTGTIQGYGQPYYYFSAGVYLTDFEDDDSNAVFTVNNFGTISGNGRSIYAGEYVYGTYYASDTTVNNFGQLIGTVELGLGADTMINAGTTIGDVLMGGDDDIFDGRDGTVSGTVFGGTGNDSYIVNHTNDLLSEGFDEGTDTVDSSVSFTLGDNFENLVLTGNENTNGGGNELSNFMIGNSGDNTLRGFAGGDVINGGAGDDRIFGGAGTDLIYGGEDNDFIRGGTGNDTILGDNGDDTLFGGKGNDSINGGNGDDVIVGGRGKDLLDGGDGADTFVFNRANHSTNDASADHIVGFEVGIDRIDLSNLIPSDFVFIGGNAFSGTEAEVRIAVNGGGNSLVRLDLNGDGVADMKIVVDSISGLTDLDFIL